MCQSGDIGLDCLYCGKWRKSSKSSHDLDLGQTMPNVELDLDLGQTMPNVELV